MALPGPILRTCVRDRYAWTHHPHGSKECKCGWPVHTTLPRTADATAVADAYGLHGLGTLHYCACSAFRYSIVKVPPLESTHTMPKVSSSPTERIPCAKFIAEGVHLPYGSAHVSGREWMDCRGAGPGLAHAQILQHREQPVGTVRAGIETIGNNGGVALTAWRNGSLSHCHGDRLGRCGCCRIV